MQSQLLFLLSAQISFLSKGSFLEKKKRKMFTHNQHHRLTFLFQKRFSVQDSPIKGNSAKSFAASHVVLPPSNTSSSLILTLKNLKVDWNKIKAYKRLKRILHQYKTCKFIFTIYLSSGEVVYWQHYLVVSNVTWLVPRKTAAMSAHVLRTTIQPCTSL